MPLDQISAHFSLAELTHTDTGLANVSNAGQGADLARLCETCLEPMRSLVGPMRVNSGFRSEAVNHAVGGVQTSQHTKGQAADVVPMQMDFEQAFRIIKGSDIAFDQLILEPSWIHISIAPEGRQPRRQCLKAIRVKGGMRYEVCH